MSDEKSPLTPDANDLPRRLDELVEGLLEGELSESQMGELNELLEQSESWTRSATSRLVEHRMLGLLHQPFNSDLMCDAIEDAIDFSEQKSVDAIVARIPDANHSPPTRLGGAGWMTAAAIALAVVSVGWLMVEQRRTDRGSSDRQEVSDLDSDDRSNATRESAPTSRGALPRAVGTMLLAEDCVWDEPVEIAEGARIGGRVSLQSGLAMLRLDGGAELLLRGQTVIDLLSPGEAMVSRGDVVVRASDEAAGFRLLTPASELIDLGTEFSVSVGEKGSTQMSVLEGEVSVRALGQQAASRQILEAGHAVAIDDPSAQPRSIEPVRARFEELVQESQPTGRADLMLAYEGFFYDEGFRPLKQARRGKGWSGPWRRRSVEEGFREEEDWNDQIQIVHGQMNVTWPVPGGQLGMLKMPAGRTIFLREMNSPLHLDQDGIYYFSLMVREPDHSKRAARSRPLEGARLTFRSSDDYYGESLSFGISTQLHPQIRTGRGVGFYSPTSAPNNQTTLWIGKVIARSEGEDEIAFRIFSEGEEFGYAEPDAWDVQSKDLNLSASLNLAVLSSQGTSARIVDELRIGPTWRSVVPLPQADDKFGTRGDRRNRASRVTADKRGDDE